VSGKGTHGKQASHRKWQGDSR